MSINKVLSSMQISVILFVLLNIIEFCGTEFAQLINLGSHS